VDLVQSQPARKNTDQWAWAIQLQRDAQLLGAAASVTIITISATLRYGC
jgi:hypothetical protein